MKTLKCFLILFAIASLCFADKKLDFLMNKGEYEKAVKYIDSKYPYNKDENIIYSLGFANEQLENNEKAVALYLIIDRAMPGNKRILASIARVYYKMCFYDKAYSYSLKLIDIDTLSGERKLQHALICYKLGKSDEALEYFSTLENTKEAKEILGHIYYEKKMYEKATPFLSQQFKQQKNDTIATKLFLCYLEQNNLDSALQYKGLTKNISVDSRLKLARLLIKNGQCEQAFIEYNKIQVLNFSFEDFCSQGNCLEKSNKLRALAFYESALKKADQEQSDRLKLKILKLYLEEKDYSGGLKYIKELEPKDIGIEYNKLAAQYYYKTKNYERTINYANKVLKLDSSAIAMYFVLIDAYEKQNMKTRAKTITEKLAKQKDTPENTLMLANYCFGNKDYKKALEFYEKVYIAQENHKLLEKIAICAYFLKNYDKANDAAESFLRRKLVSNKCREILYKIALNNTKYSVAISHLEILVQAEPKLVFYKDLMTCYKATNDTEKLLSVDAKIVKLDKKDIESRERLAASYITNHKDSSALIIYYELEKLRLFTIDDYFKIVSLLEKKNDNETAILYLKKIASIDPTNDEAQKRLGDAYFKLKKYDEAYLKYNKTMTLNYSRTDYLKDFCHIVITKQNNSEIIRICNRAIAVNQYDTHILVSLGNTYYAMPYYLRALQAFQKIPQEQIDTTLLLKIAVCQEKTGAISNAILSYEQYVNLAKNTKNEFLALANLYAKLDKKDFEIVTLKTYLKKYKDDKVFIKVAIYEYEKSNFTGADKYFSAANLSRDPELMFMFGKSKYMLKQYDDAISILTLCEKFKSFSKLPEVYQLVAISHEKLKNIEKAIQYYKLYVKIATRDSTTCYHIGKLQEQLHVNLAKDIYELNSKKFINDNRNFYRLAEIYYKLKDFERAKKAFERVKVLKDSVSIDLLLKLACCYKETNGKVNEIKTYKEILSKNGRNFTANKKLGVYYYEAGELSEGLAYLELAKAQNYNDPDVLYILGRIYLKDRFSTDGIMFLQAAKKQKPQEIKIRIFLIESYKKYSRLQEALVEIEELLKIDRNFKNLNLYARTLFELKNYTAAENVALEMRKKEPRDTDLIMFLTQIKIEQGSYDDALEYCKIISYIDSRHTLSICKRADILILKKDIELAKSYYLKALQIDSQCAMAYYGLAMVYKFSGDKKLYREHIVKAVEFDSTNSVITEELKRVK